MLPQCQPLHGAFPMPGAVPPLPLIHVAGRITAKGTHYEQTTYLSLTVLPSASEQILLPKGTHMESSGTRVINEQRGQLPQEAYSKDRLWT